MAAQLTVRYLNRFREELCRWHGRRQLKHCLEFAQLARQPGRARSSVGAATFMLIDQLFFEEQFMEFLLESQKIPDTSRYHAYKIIDVLRMFTKYAYFQIGSNFKILWLASSD